RVWLRHFEHNRTRSRTDRIQGDESQSELSLAGCGETPENRRGLVAVREVVVLLAARPLGGSLLQTRQRDPHRLVALMFQSNNQAGLHFRVAAWPGDHGPFFFRDTFESHGRRIHLNGTAGWETCLKSLD